MSERAWPAWLALLAGVAVAAFAVSSQNPPEAVPTSAPADVFSAGRAMEHVRQIAQGPHATGSAENQAVREYILLQLKALKIEAEVQSPRDPGRPERNIVARLKGKGTPGKKAVMLGAHYDSVGTGPGAGDNASGVAVVLETLRALKAGPSLDRDVIALIDDGEETGLNGASLFVKEHPWAREVGVVLNFDAGGNKGPSIMFETSAENGWLIRQYAESSPHPLATSMSMDIYRIMPNDTNLTVFKQAGMDGLNFVISRGLGYYHSSEDTPANLDLGSVQHQGENALAITRHLGRLDLEKVRQDDVIYFSVLDRFVLHYPARLAMPFALGAGGVFVLTLLLGLVMGRVKPADLAIGIGTWFLAAILAIFAAAIFWMALRDMTGTFGIPWFKFDLAVLTACAVVAATVTLGVERLAGRGRSLEAMSLGAMAWWVASAIASAQYLPGASYLFTWPAIAAMLGLGLSMMMKRGSGLAKEAILLGSVPALLLLPPLSREAFEGLSLRMAGPLMILVALFLGVVLPLLGPIVSSRRPR